jgi:hypothetical protein
MALISKQKYDPEQLQKLANLVRIYKEKDQPFDYEIAVDGLKVVRRTNDPEMFFLFENFITGETKNIEVIFYNGNSNVNEKRIFTFIEDTPDKGLSGVEVDARIQEQVEKQKKEWEHGRLLEENKELKQEVDELEKEVERLEKVNEDLINSQSPFKGFLGEMGSSFVESFIRRNPNVMKNIPGGEALAGLIGKDDVKESTVTEDAEVVFTSKTGLSEDEKSAIQFVDQIKAQFTRPEFDNILLILQSLANDKSKIERVLELVKG